MSLTTWLAAGWLQKHNTSAAEIRDLWLIVERDLEDAASGGINGKPSEMDLENGQRVVEKAVAALTAKVLAAKNHNP